MYTSSSKLTNTTEHNNLIRRNASNNSHSTIRGITPFQCMRHIKHNHSKIRARLGEAGAERVQIKCREPTTTVMKRQPMAGISSKGATDGVRALVDGLLSSLQVNTIRHMGNAGNPRISGNKEMDGDSSNNNL
jgi:hypothetical protein